MTFFDKYIAKPMRNANVKDYKAGVKKITGGLDNKGPIPVKFVTETALRVPAIFGRAVEGVRVTGLKDAKQLQDAKFATAVGAAGSAGAFGQAAYEAGGIGKDALALTPKPVQAAAAPVVGLAAGVVSVPLAARYAPGAAANLALKAPLAVAAVGATAAGATYAAVKTRNAPPAIHADVEADRPVPHRLHKPKAKRAVPRKTRRKGRKRKAPAKRRKLSRKVHGKPRTRKRTHRSRSRRGLRRRK